MTSREDSLGTRSFFLRKQNRSRTKNELHNCSIKANSMRSVCVYEIRCFDNVAKRSSATIHALRNYSQLNVLCCAPNLFTEYRALVACLAAFLYLNSGLLV